jgi:hypothetical protein
MSQENAFPGMIWLEPWSELDNEDERKSLENQLVREVGPKHVLFGQRPKLVARRYDRDDALFLLDDGRLADVHLTWRRDMEPDPRWPSCGLFDSIEEWAREVMEPDSRDFPGY